MDEESELLPNSDILAPDETINEAKCNPIHIPLHTRTGHKPRTQEQQAKVMACRLQGSQK